MSITCTVKIKSGRDALQAWELYMEFIGQNASIDLAGENQWMQTAIEDLAFPDILDNIRDIKRTGVHRRSTSSAVRKTLDVLEAWAKSKGKTKTTTFPLSPDAL